MGADATGLAGASLAGRLGRFWRAARANDWSRIIAAAVVVGAVLAASGGFGTDDLMIAPRFAYWLGLFLAGAGIGRIASLRLVPRAWFNDRRRLWAMGLISVLVGLPMTVVVAISSLLIGGHPLNPARIWIRLCGAAPSTIGVTFGMTALAFLVQSRTAPATPAAAAGAPPARFLARLPPRLAGASLWAVEAEDHYLRLHTSKGQDLILMRLADALTELEGLAGARTHRSWWVARAAVLHVERAEGRATLTLEGDLQAPVSRGYLKALREAGWF